MLELFILVECKATFIQNFRIGWFTGQSIGQVIDGLWKLFDIDVNIASLHQEILISWFSLQSLVEII